MTLVRFSLALQHWGATVFIGRVHFRAGSDIGVREKQLVLAMVSVIKSAHLIFFTRYL